MKPTTRICITNIRKYKENSKGLKTDPCITFFILQMKLFYRYHLRKVLCWFIMTETN